MAVAILLAVLNIVNTTLEVDMCINSHFYLESICEFSCIKRC